ncbi:hypothetical protein D3C83_03540 [compost metagenome]
MHLRDVHARFRAPRIAFQVKAKLREFGVGEPFAPVARAGALECFGIVALLDPFLPQGGQPRTDVDVRRRIGVGARGVVDEDRRILLCPHGSRRVRLSDLAHRHPDVRARALDVDLARIGQRLHRRIIDVRGCVEKPGIGVHVRSLRQTARDGLETSSRQTDSRRKIQGRGEGETDSTLPCAGIIRIRFEGTLSPAGRRPQDPYVGP